MHSEISPVFNLFSMYSLYIVMIECFDFCFLGCMIPSFISRLYFTAIYVASSVESPLNDFFITLPHETEHAYVTKKD